jgi:hypothetical protein
MFKKRLGEMSTLNWAFSAFGMEKTKRPFNALKYPKNLTPKMFKFLLLKHVPTPIW